MLNRSFLSTLAPTLLFAMSFIMPHTYAQEHHNNIRLHLIEAAKQVSTPQLDDIHTLEDWESVRPERYNRFLEMMSLTDVPLEGERPPLNVTPVDVIQQDGFRIEKLYYESLPQLYVPANLYIPDNLDGPAPGILYVCGHARTQKVHYQTHARKFARLGFVCLVIETIQWGEVRGHHWGTYAEGRFNWLSRGYTPGGVELWNGIRGLDLLCEREEVDCSRLGVTGNSGGGAYSWYIAAGDERIQAAAPICGTSTVWGHVHQRTIDGHCDCMMPSNAFGWDVHDIGMLISPRPLLIGATTGDGLNDVNEARRAYDYIRRIHALYESEENIGFISTPGNHGYTPEIRKTIFAFFMNHLMDKDVTPEEAGDLDLSPDDLLSEEELRVYVDGPPADDRTTTIHYSFQSMAEPPSINTAEELFGHRDQVVNFLLERSFHAFPKETADLDARLVFRDEESAQRRTIDFVTEPGFRLRMDMRYRQPLDEPNPLLIALRNPGEARWASEGFVSGAPSSWNLAYFESRGTGETSWGPDLQWHIRRAAAWTGRTLPSMRVYDVLRCLEAAREQPGIDAERIALVARGEMAVVALYAALLDGGVHSVILGNPPASQDVEGDEDGRDIALEIMHSLRVTDLAQVAGLLHPTQVVFVGDPPETYRWAITTREQIGAGDTIRVVERMGEL